MSTRTLAFVAATTLMVGLLAGLLTPVSAQAPDETPGARPTDGPERPARDDPDRERGPRGDRGRDGGDGAPERDRPRAMPEDRPERGQRVQAIEDQCGDNATDDRCEKARATGEPAAKARREAHAMMGAIKATQRQLDRVEAVQARVGAQLTDTNTTEAEAAALERRLERLEALQERLGDRLERLQERLDRLHSRWQEVREHVAERRAEGEFDRATCEERRDDALERAGARRAAGLSAAEARLDRFLAQENLTEEQKERAWTGHNATVERIEAAFVAAQQGVQGAHEDCLARTASEDAGETGSA